MLRALIVDDEPNQSEGLRRFIDWEGCGFSPPIVCSSADEAIAVLQKNTCEVLLADINMPQKSGIQLVKEIHQLKLSPDIVFISGYDDFDYARQAVSLGVKDYILKPVQPREVEKRLKELRDRRLSESLTVSFSIRREITAFLLSAQQHQKNFTIPGLPTEFCAYLCLSRCEGDAVAEAKELDHNLEGMNENLLLFTALPIKSNMILLLAADLDVRAVQELPLRLRDAGLQKESKNTTSCVEWCCLEELYTNYLSLFCTLNAASGKTTGDKIVEHFSAALLSVDLCSLTEMQEQLLLLAKTSDLDLYRNICIEVACAYTQLLRQVEALPGISSLIAAESHPELMGIMELYYNTFVQIAYQKDEHLAVQNALAYLKQNYRKNPSLGELSAHVNMNPSYLSALFKKKTGANITEFILKCRMDKAKELLLHSDMRIGEICDYIGYKTPAYFIDQFKKQYNCTPKQMRKRFLGMADH